MSKGLIQKLTRRERQIMDIVYRKRAATAAEIRKRMPDPPSYSSVRAQLRILEEKGFLRHSLSGKRYVYHPAIAPDRAKRTALKHMLNTFFAGSADAVVSTLMDISGSKLSDEEYERLRAVIDKARKGRE